MRWMPRSCPSIRRSRSCRSFLFMLYPAIEPPPRSRWAFPVWSIPWGGIPPSTWRADRPPRVAPVGFGGAGVIAPPGARRIGATERASKGALRHADGADHPTVVVAGLVAGEQHGPRLVERDGELVRLPCLEREGVGLRIGLVIHTHPRVAHLRLVSHLLVLRPDVEVVYGRAGIRHDEADRLAGIDLHRPGIEAELVEGDNLDSSDPIGGRRTIGRRVLTSSTARGEQQNQRRGSGDERDVLLRHTNPPSCRSGTSGRRGARSSRAPHERVWVDLGPADYRFDPSRTRRRSVYSSSEISPRANRSSRMPIPSRSWPGLAPAPPTERAIT